MSHDQDHNDVRSRLVGHLQAYHELELREWNEGELTLSELAAVHARLHREER